MKVKVKDPVPYLLIILIGLAVFSISLWFPPTYGDDLRYLTSTSEINNPLSYFVSSHIISSQNLGNNLYRPLVSISFWVTYKIFGVWAFPNQLIGILVHILTTCIFYKTILRLSKNEILSLVISLIFLVSPATFWTATQVSDRTINYIGLLLMLFIYHIFFNKKINIVYIAALSVFAILSKEAGLIIPLLVIMLFFLKKCFVINNNLVNGKTPLIFSIFLILFYMGLRILIFGGEFATYSQNGYLFFGLVSYKHPMDLPYFYPYLAYAENILKNIITPFFPILTGNGSVVIRTWEFVIYFPILLATAILSVISLTQKLNKIQILALIIIFLNALLHFSLFRYRVLYLAQIGFCLFLSSSPKLLLNKKNKWNITVFRVVIYILLIYSVLWISWWLSTHLVQRYTIHMNYIENLLQLSPTSMDTTIDKKTILRVLEFYKR